MAAARRYENVPNSTRSHLPIDRFRTQSRTHVNVKHLVSLYSLFVIQRYIGQILPAGPVHGVREPRMIGFQLRPMGQNLVGVLIQVPDAQREPRYVFCGPTNGKIHTNVKN